MLRIGKNILIAILLVSLVVESLAQARTRRGISRPEYYKDLALREDTQTVTKVVLRNGLTALISEIHTIPLAAIVTYVKSGYLDEPDPIAGVSDVMKHMLFAGTKKREAGRVYKDTLTIGGNLNGRASYDSTSYATVVPAERVGEALEIQADALQNPTFDEAELANIVPAVVQEAKRQHDDTRAYGLAKLHELAFDNPRIRRSSFGSEATIKSLTRDQIVKYYQDVYKPSHIILSICGDVNTESVIKEVVRRYAAMPKGAVKKSESPAEPAQTKLKYNELRGDINQTGLFVGYHTPGLSDKDYYPLRVLTTLLGEGWGSVLNLRLKEDLKLVNSLSSRLDAVKGVGMFSVQLWLEPQNLDKAELALLTEIEALKERDISEQDLQRAVALIEKDFYTELETVDGRAQTLARFEDVGGFKALDTYLDKIRKVTADDIERVLKNYFQTSRCSILEYQPRSAEARGYTPDSFRQTIDQILPPSVQQRLSEKPEKDLLHAFKPSNTKYKFVPRQLVSPLVRSSIRGGPEIFIKEDHTTPLVSLGVFFSGGKLLEDETNSGITELMLRTVLKGTEKRPARFIATQLEIWGGEVSPVVEDDYFGYTLTILSKNAEDALKLLLDLMTGPTFEDEEVAKEKQSQLADIIAAKDDELVRVIDLFRKAAFGKHPYGLPRHGLASAVQNLKAENLKAWHKAYMMKARPVVCIAGDTEGTALASFFARYLKYTEYDSVKTPKLKEMTLASTVLEKEDRPRQVTSVVLGFPVSDTLADSAYPLELLTHLAASPGEVTISFRDGLLGGALYSYLSVSPENEANAVERAKSRFAKLKDFSDEEFKRAVYSTIGSYQVAIQHRLSLLDRMIKNFLLGRGHEEPNEYASKIKSVTKDDVKSVARRYIDPEHQAIGIVRGVPTQLR